MKYKEDTKEELLEKIKKEKERLKELQEQDESNFSEMELWFKGRKNNIPLVKAHISYYSNKLRELEKNSLNKWFQKCQ